MFRIGMIGAGIISGCHLAAVASHPKTQLVAVADLSEDRATKAAKPYGASVYTDYHQMLAQEQLDAVIINLPHGLHEACALECAEHGLHMLMEKPMSVSGASCRRILHACEKHRVLLQVGHIQRYRPENRAARAIIDSGELGQLVMISDLSTIDYFVPERPDWFLKKELAGGGISLNYGVHALDRFHYLSQSPLRSITGVCTCWNPESDVDGSAQFFAQAENGVSCSVTICGYPCKQEDVTMIYCTKGSMRLRANRDLYRTINGEYHAVDFSEYPPMFEAQWADFVEGLEIGQVLHNSGRKAMAYVNAIEAIW